MKQATDRRIVVLTNGWVFVGDWFDAVGSQPAKIVNASCIRTWGTTKGLGQLALEGVQKNTVLEECGAVLFTQPAALLFTISVLHDNL